MAQVMTEAECIDKMWDERSPMVSKSGFYSEWSRDLGSIEQSWVSGYSRPEELACKNALHNECGGQPLADRVPVSSLAKQRGLWDNWSSWQWIVKSAQSRCSRLLRFGSMSGKAGDEHVRNQVHRKMERASRAILGICKDDWWRQGAVRIPHISWQKDERNRAWDRWMGSTRSRRIWTPCYSRNLSSSNYFHGNDDGSSDSSTGTERR